MKRFCILTLALTLMQGCIRSGLIERRIVERVNDCVPNASCIIRVADLTDFRWDQMHVYTLGARPDEIEKALGTPLPNYVEFQRRIVFLKDGKIVHREDEPTDIERPVDGEVNFAESYPEPAHWSFTPETAVFSAEKKKFDGGAYYVLKQEK
jgi:hypothetical protein